MDKTEQLQALRNALSEDVEGRKNQMKAIYQDELLRVPYLLIFTAEQSNKHINLFKPREITDIKMRVLQLWQLLVSKYERVQHDLNSQPCKEVIEVIRKPLHEIRSNIQKLKAMDHTISKSVRITSSTSEFLIYALGVHLVRYGYGEIMEYAIHHCDKKYRLPRNATPQQMKKIMNMMTSGWDGTNDENVERLKAYGKGMRQELQALMTKHAKQRANIIKQMLQACDWLEDQLKKIAKLE